MRAIIAPILIFICLFGFTLQQTSEPIDGFDQPMKFLGSDISTNARPSVVQAAACPPSQCDSDCSSPIYSVDENFCLICTCQANCPPPFSLDQ